VVEELGARRRRNNGRSAFRVQATNPETVFPAEINQRSYDNNFAQQAHRLIIVSEAMKKARPEAGYQTSEVRLATSI